MTQYVDGFLLPVPKDKIEAYKSLALKAADVWMEHGALAYWENIEDDLSMDGMSFRKCAEAKEDEVVAFSWVVYPSRESRDHIMAAVMSDPRLQDNSDMPFDMKRMAYGGFKPLVAIEKDESN